MIGRVEGFETAAFYFFIVEEEGEEEVSRHWWGCAFLKVSFRGQFIRHFEDESSQAEEQVLSMFVL